ncbi:MAG: hypothetical protein JST00_31285 [Deltaproteobacteria bacterium]|nr:hypothetical protein [Deltaproteobacteria bacterium]
MNKYLVLYFSSVSSEQQMASATQEQAKAAMGAWMAWGQRASHAITDMGAPVGRGLRLTKGSRGATSSRVAGYGFFQAETAEKLAEVLEGHPHFAAPDAAIEILELLPMPGM